MFIDGFEDYISYINFNENLSIQIARKINYCCYCCFRSSRTNIFEWLFYLIIV